MSIYYPQCVASNKEVVYSLSKEMIGDNLHTVLIRSSNNPSTIFNAPWEVIAVSSSEDLDPNSDDKFLWTLVSKECSVDNDGNFYLWARKNDEYNIFKFARTSHSTISPSNKCRKNNPLYGQWSKTTISLYANVMYKRGMSVQDPRNTTGAATVVFHPNVEEALPPIAPPTVLYASVNTTLSQSFLYNQHMEPMVLVSIIFISVTVFFIISLSHSNQDEPLDPIDQHKRSNFQHGLWRQPDVCPPQV